MLCVNCFDPAHLPFGDARTSQLGSAAQTCPGAAQAAAEQRFLPAGGAPHSKATGIRRQAAPICEAGRPRWARPCRGWPDTNARASQTTQREREGRRLQRGQPPPKPKRVWTTGPPPPARPFAAAARDQGPSRGYLHVRGMGLVVGVACWPDTFWLGRWLPSLQPPPFPLSSSRLSGT